MTLTTAAKVRTRLNIEIFQASDATIGDFISNADGLIKYILGSLPVSGDDDYELAVSTSTGIAAYYTAMQLPYPEDEEEAKAWSDKLKHMRSITDGNLDTLSDTHTVPVAKSTTTE